MHWGCAAIHRSGSAVHRSSCTHERHRRRSKTIPAITGISFCHDQFVFFDLGEVCGNVPAAKRARVEALVRALASEARDATPKQSVLDQVGEGPVDELLCDETLDDEPLDDEAGYESPEPTPMTARERERILCAPEKQRP